MFQHPPTRAMDILIFRQVLIMRCPSGFWHRVGLWIYGGFFGKKPASSNLTAYTEAYFLDVIPSPLDKTFPPRNAGDIPARCQIPQFYCLPCSST